MADQFIDLLVFTFPLAPIRLRGRRSTQFKWKASTSGEKMLTELLEGMEQREPGGYIEVKRWFRSHHPGIKMRQEPL